jgi:hypothetical protein
MRRFAEFPREVQVGFVFMNLAGKLTGSRNPPKLPDGTSFEKTVKSRKKTTTPGGISNEWRMALKCNHGLNIELTALDGNMMFRFHREATERGKERRQNDKNASTPISA